MNSSDHRKQMAASLELLAQSANRHTLKQSREHDDDDGTKRRTRSNHNQIQIHMQATPTQTTQANHSIGESEIRDMKLKQRQNSIDYKRKKRKYADYGWQRISIRRIGRQPTTIPKHKRLGLITVINVLLCTTIAKLLCDNPNSANADPQQQQEPPNRQRFVEEPRDTYALLYHSADLPCAVENVRGTLHWQRGLLLAESDKVLMTRYSLPNYRAPDRAAAAAAANGGELNDDQINTVANYTLHIDPVQLSDDAQFRCGVRGADKVSHAARLTVLHPPEQLTIKSHSVEEADEDAADGGDSRAPSEPDADVVVSSGARQQRRTAAAAATIEPTQQQADHQHHDATSIQRVTDGGDSGAAASASNPNWTHTMSASAMMLDSSPDEAGAAGSAMLNDDPAVGAIDRLIVKQNARLRLECGASRAKPHAQLVWLDHLQQPVPKRQDNDSTTASASYVDEEIRVDAEEDKMELAALVWSLKVQRHHQNQVFTCVARHPAYEQARLFPQLHGREPKRRIRLDVHYKPDILGLIKEPSQAHENQSITFSCNAQARPADLQYRWLIDNQLVANATRPELRIARVTRQMHLREIRCQVRNSVGVSSIGHKLHVRYAPAFITHLLPESLQPAQDNEPPLLLKASAVHGRPQQQQQLVAHNKLHNNMQLDSVELAAGRQLTRGYLIGQEVQLRCDFDSNPRIHQVQWFKVMNEKYSIMGNVTPAEADELIAWGEARAHFVPANDSSTKLIDYEAMSENLLDELASYEDLMSQQTQQASDGQQQQNTAFQSQNIEKIPSQPPTQTTVAIHEPIQWMVAAGGSQAPAGHKGGGNAKVSGAEPAPSPFETADAGGQAASELLLLLAANTTTAAAALQKREAQVTSSVINLNKTNYESAGKYICRARTGDGSTSVARSIYLVLKGQPRIISSPNQWGPFGASKLQVECLAQTRGVVDNMTSFSWFKDGKPILARKDHVVTGTGGRIYNTQVDRSPDLLYMRSTLHVDGAEFHDFGKYSCLVINSFGNDSMPINLQPSAPTGFVFAVMASLAMGSVLLLVCILGLLMVCAPQRRLHNNNTKSALSNQDHHQHHHHHSDMIGKSSHSIDSQRDERETLGNCNGLHIGNGNEDDELDVCDNHESAAINNKATAAQFVVPCQAAAAAAAINSMMMLGANQLNGSQQQEHQLHHLTSNDHSGDSSDSSSRNNNKRSSLRQPIVVGSQKQQQQQRSTKFAAIHESLEHKLHLGQPLFAASHHLRQASIDSSTKAGSEQPSEQQEQQLQAQLASADGAAKTAMAAVSELDEGSLLNRLWTRLLMRQPADKAPSSGGSRRIKSRPIISMPIDQQRSQSSNIRRSSFSTSLSVLANSNADSTSDTASADNAKNNKTLQLKRTANNGINHLVSSSANLIQDSTTASDGSGSSGRSSSNSSGGHAARSNNEPHHRNHQTGHQQQPANGVQHRVGYATTGGYMQQQQQQQSINGSDIGWQSNDTHISPITLLDNGHHQQANGGVPMTDCSLYVNDMAATYFRPDSQNTIYSRPSHLAAAAAAAAYQQNQIDPSYPMTSIGYTSEPWPSDLSQSAPLGHYQHPNMPAGESYFAPSAAAQQQQQSSFYATICNSNKAGSHYGVVSTNNNNNTCVTPPYRPASTQCNNTQQQRMIPTSDAGDAFFDQNYGTMLSRSKAYTKLGYATSSALMATHYIAAHSVSSSSSPHSSSSHTNTGPPNLNLDTITQQLQQAVDATSTCEPYGDCMHTTTTTNTMVQPAAAGSIGGASITKHIDDNGLATHV